MGIVEIIGAVLMIITSVLIVIFTMLQDPKSDALSGLTGGSDSFFGKNSARTMDAMLAKYTKIAGIVFFVLTVVVYAAGAYL